MKKVLASSLLIGCFAGAAYAGLPAGTGVNGSLHDMNTYNNGTLLYQDAMGRVCVFCHTPHNSIKSVDGADYPLWNHKGVDDGTTYTPYVWATNTNRGDITGGVGANDIIGNAAIIGPSRLCLSCHDGNVAIDQHNGTTFANAKEDGTIFMGAVSGGRANLGTDLSDDHPIGFDYNTIATYRNAKSTYVNAAGSEIATSDNRFASDITLEATTQGKYNKVDRPLTGRTIKDVLYQGTYMTCATCHEVHNKDNATQALYTDITPGAFTASDGRAPAPNYFLYAKEKNSLICLSCHVK
jgi:hypothetical protein